MKTALELIQAEGPTEKTPDGYERWYNKILAAANGMIPIKGEMGEQSETVGDYDPIAKKFVPGRHTPFVNLGEEEEK